MKKILLIAFTVLIFTGCSDPYTQYTKAEVLLMEKDCWEQGLKGKEIIDGWGVIIDLRCVKMVTTSPTTQGNK